MRKHQANLSRQSRALQRAERVQILDETKAQGAHSRSQIEWFPICMSFVFLCKGSDGNPSALKMKAQHRGCWGPVFARLLHAACTSALGLALVAVEDPSIDPGLPLARAYACLCFFATQC